MSIRLYTVPQAAEQLQVGDNTVYRLIASGALSAVDVRPVGSKRSKTRVSEDAIAKFIAARTRTA